MPAEGRVRRSDGTVLSVGRITLHYRAWEAASARAVIIVVHGLGEHGGRYERFGSAMAGFGFSSYALDLRGHGSSEGKRGHVPTFGVFLQDLDRFRREVQDFTPAHTPLFLMGHSMGGLIALRYQQEYRTTVAGAVISAPWLATALPIPRWKVTTAAALARVLPALPMSNHLEASDLSHDPAVAEAYRADPLVHGRITPRLFVEASAAMGLVLQRSDRLSRPLLFLIPGADRIVDAQRSLRFARQLPAELTTIKLYPGMYHEVFNEVDRETALRDIRDWIAARIA